MPFDEGSIFAAFKNKRQQVEDSVRSAIKQKLKQAFDSISNEQVKQNFLQAIPFWLASLVTGLFAVGYAQVFAFTERFAMGLLTNHAWWMFAISPLCFVVAWYLVHRFAPYARGSGIPQIMAALELTDGKHKIKVSRFVSLRISVVKVVSSLLMIMGGAAVGREGPTIQIAGSIFVKIHQWLPHWWPRISKRNMIMTGAAAGLAAAFNTPLGGIVFAVEELTKTHINYFKAAIFTAVIIAGLTAQTLAGSYLYFGYPRVEGYSNLILFGVTLVAMIAGIAGAGMSELIVKVVSWKRSFTKITEHLAFLVCCSLALLLMALLVNKAVVGSGKELITHALFTDEKYTHWYIPVLRIIGPLFSFTTGAAGGVFAPGLSAGGTIGATLSAWLNLTPADSNVLILAGMVAFLTGITRAPFTSAILVLEMTDRHNLILHLMMAGLLASFFALLVSRHSFYDQMKQFYLKEVEGE